MYQKWYEKTRTGTTETVGCCVNISKESEVSNMLSEEEFIRLYYIKDENTQIVIIDLLAVPQSPPESSDQHSDTSDTKEVHHLSGVYRKRN